MVEARKLLEKSKERLQLIVRKERTEDRGASVAGTSGADAGASGGAAAAGAMGIDAGEDDVFRDLWWLVGWFVGSSVG